MQNVRLIITDNDSDGHRQTLAERSARERRIEALSVDRSRFVGGTFYWSPEAEAAEASLQEIREAVTIEERIAAWRGLGLNVRREQK